MYIDIFLHHPIYYPCTTFAIPLSSNSDPGSHRGPFSPLPTTVRAFIFIAGRFQHFIPSSTRVELGLPTLLGALRSLSGFFSHFCKKNKISPWWESNSRTNASSIREKPLDHRGDWLLYTFATGARQFVVQDALETTAMSGVYLSWFTPITNIGASPEGAEITTFFAPPILSH